MPKIKKLPKRPTNHKSIKHQVVICSCGRFGCQDVNWGWIQTPPCFSSTWCQAPQHLSSQKDPFPFWPTLSFSVEQKRLKVQIHFHSGSFGARSFSSGTLSTIFLQILSWVLIFPFLNSSSSFYFFLLHLPSFDLLPTPSAFLFLDLLLPFLLFLDLDLSNFHHFLQNYRHRHHHLPNHYVQGPSSQSLHPILPGPAWACYHAHAEPLTQIIWLVVELVPLLPVLMGPLVRSTRLSVGSLRSFRPGSLHPSLLLVDFTWWLAPECTFLLEFCFNCAR